MNRTPTDRPPLAATGPRAPEPRGERAVSTPAAPRPGRSAAQTSHPVRIGRIGADHIQVSIRPALHDAELLVLVDRLALLIDAGYDSIDVVFEESGGR